MARQRMIKPEFFKDKRMAALGAQVALVYVALWQAADDGGVARIEPDLLKGEVFSRWVEYSQSLLIECLVRLAGAGRIRPYVVGDELYAEMPTLLKHQTIQHPSKFRHPRKGKAVSDLRAWLSGQFLIEGRGGLMEHSPPIAEAEPESLAVPESKKPLRSRASTTAPEPAAPSPWGMDRPPEEMPGRQRRREPSQGMSRMRAAVAEMAPEILPRTA